MPFGGIIYQTDYRFGVLRVAGNKLPLLLNGVQSFLEHSIFPIAGYKGVDIRIHERNVVPPKRGTGKRWVEHAGIPHCDGAAVFLYASHRIIIDGDGNDIGPCRYLFAQILDIGLAIDRKLYCAVGFQAGNVVITDCKVDDVPPVLKVWTASGANDRAVKS